MKILGIDFGEAKVGLAVSESWLAEPLEVLRYRSLKRLLRQLATICDEQEAEKIVIGLSEGEMAEKQRRFAGKLSAELNLPIEFEDETLTSKEAIIKMREKGKKIKDEDAVSAALILQRYLERTGN